jgi:AAA domain-containing protein
MFKKLENNRPFAKIAFEGFAGDGKSFTATHVAIGIHKLIQSKKPIAIFDTEKAFKALKPQFDTAGIEAVVNDEQRSLEALNQAIKWCEEGNADILIIDSITHVYESFLQAFMKQKNRSRLQFEDWGILKPMWKEKFSTPFVQARVHIIFTGRAGYEYSDEKNAETGKREIFKSGIKMKAENETAFEPDILVLMEKEMQVLTDKKQIWREATILKDRTSIIDGKTFKNPTFNDFYPAIAQLLDGVIKEYSGAEIPDTFDDWESKFSAQKIKKGKVISEIEGAFNLMKLGTSGADKQLKAATLKKVFNVLSIDKLEDVHLNILNEGLEILNDFANAYNIYMQQCLDEQKTPDLKNGVAPILEDIINEQRNALSVLDK